MASGESSQRINGCALFFPLLVASLQLSGYFLHRPAGTAVDALLDVRAESFQLGDTEFLAIFQGPEPVTDQLAGAGITALLDLALDELLEMYPDDVALRHGCLPVVASLVYQKLIVAAIGIRPGPTLLVVRRSSSANYYLCRWYPICSIVEGGHTLCNAPVQRRRASAVRCNRLLAGHPWLLHHHNLRRHPGAVEYGRLRPVDADVERERAVRRGHPVAFLVLARRLSAEIQGERTV